MPATQPLSNDQLWEAELKARTVKVLLTIKTAPTSSASITITADNPAVQPVWIGGPSPGDTGCSFPSLTSTANSVIGLLVNDGNLATTQQTPLPYRATKTEFKNIPAGGVASLTAITATPCGTSSTGVTASRNGAVALTLTGITLNATATTQYLYTELEFFQQ
jgi:hypothetical protein